jgi:APA family basic amino acid/polyamine antiporter
MGRAGDLPKLLAYLGPGKNPWPSVLFVGLIAILVSSFFPFESAVKVSTTPASFGTLFYYSVTNVSALRLQPNQRFYPRGLATAGLVGCIGLSIALPPQDIGIGVAIALAGIALRLVRVKIISHKWDCDLYILLWRLIVSVIQGGFLLCIKLAPTLPFRKQ